MIHWMVFIVMSFSLLTCAVGQDISAEQAHQQIAELEAKLAALPPGKFDFDVHNELRHWYGAVDSKQSMAHIEIILKNKPFNEYMQQVLGGKDTNKVNAVATLTATATKFAEFPNLAAACWLWAGDLEADQKKARGYFDQAFAVKGAETGYREAAQDRVQWSGNRQPWPAKIAAPNGMESSPGPWSDPDDTTVWPNTTSRANSDPWIAENHEKIRVMRPRVLLINFSNEHSRDQLQELTRLLIAALAESSRYHGYCNPRSPVFLQYQVFNFVDLRDPERQTGDSRRIPVKDPSIRRGFNMKYRQYFSAEFAEYYGIADPRAPQRFLRLDELLDGGYVHEVWFFQSGNVKAIPHVGAYEVVEEKPRYDEKFQKVANEWVQAGNGGDAEQPWVGRSCRIGCVNASRGIGCFLESLAHGVEGTSNSGVIPNFTKYFRQYADFNLKERYNLPFENLYEVQYGSQQIKYPDPQTMVVSHGGKEFRVENYIPAGGSAHFPPNARGHYDLDSDSPVLSTIEDWRIGSGPGGNDVAKPFTHQVFRGFRGMAPDCMGAWLIYWRQNMPGLDNKQKDDARQPMKNWLPFLFY